MTNHWLPLWQDDANKASSSLGDSIVRYEEEDVSMNEKFKDIEVCVIRSESYDEEVYVLNTCGICQIEDTIQDLYEEEHEASNAQEFFKLVVDRLNEQGCFAKIIDIDEAIID